MAHIVDHLLSAHHLGPVHEQQGGQAEGKEDPVGSNLTGYQRQPAAGQSRLQALQQWAPHLGPRHEVLHP